MLVHSAALCEGELLSNSAARGGCVATIAVEGCKVCLVADCEGYVAMIPPGVVCFVPQARPTAVFVRSRGIFSLGRFVLQSCIVILWILEFPPQDLPLFMEGHSGQKCNLIATCIPLDRTFGARSKVYLNCKNEIKLDRTFLPLDRTFLPFDRTSIILSLALLYITLVYSSVAFHIYPYLRGNSIPLDRNYRSAVVIIWSAVKRGRLNLDLVFVWRHTTYDYVTYN